MMARSVAVQGYFGGRKCNKRSALAEPCEQGTVLGTEFACQTLECGVPVFGSGCKTLVQGWWEIGKG